MLQPGSSNLNFGGPDQSPVQNSKIVWTEPKIRFSNGILPELLPNKAEVQSKIAEPNWTQV